MSGPGVINNGAGVSNLLAFSLTLDPRSPDLAGLPQLITVTADGGAYPALRFRRWKNAPGLGYILEAGGNLSAIEWSASGVVAETSDHGDGTVTVTLRDLLPVAGNTRRFLRLRVTMH